MVAHRIEEVLPAMRAAEAALARGRYVAGFVAYEAAPAFDAALAAMPAGEVPLVWLGTFTAPVAAPPGAAAAQARGATWTPAIGADEHRRGVDTIRDAIACGDSYQVNYTFRLHAELDPESLETTYLRLLAEQRPSYAAYLDVGPWRVLSLSPELFFRVADGTITTKPMKGTAPRGLWVEDDARCAAALASSDKNRAENVMIVDLSRNDIGRIAEIGSVRATSLFDVERYPAVFQLVSTVQGRLRPGVVLSDLFSAMFPAGSITGAPKTSSTRVIAAVERAPRGVYCGAIGYASPAGEMCFNVAIRTAVVETATGRATCGTGGGITWDSTPADEYAEAVSKVSFLSPLPVFDLFETMRSENGACLRLDRHLARMKSSAAYFDFLCDESALEIAVLAHAARHGHERRRVRLRLSQNGQAAVESEPFDFTTAGPHAVTLAESPVDSRDRFLYHKTTRRDVYAKHRAPHPDVFDVLLWNERGELTEFTIGNVVLEIDGQRWTPRRESGLLAGVFRGALLEAGAILERRLLRDDLAIATRVWLINSLREWVEVRIHECHGRTAGA